jgi:predicted phage-related endonuclease
LTDVSAALRALSEPWERGDKIKAAIARSARAAGLTYWRAFDIWYGKARRIDPAEADRIQAALQRKSEEHARNEFHELRTRLLRLESLLVQTDAQFRRPTIDQTRDAMRNIGRPDRALDRKR